MGLYGFMHFPFLKMNTLETSCEENVLRMLCRYLVADLAQVLVSYLPEDSLYQLYKLVLPLTASLQPRPQKKAYQMLYHLTSSKEPVCVHFVGRHVAEIAQSLVDSSSCVCAGSRRVGPLLTLSQGCVVCGTVGCNECTVQPV